MAEMTIGELAGRFGLATHVLRHWEDVGLLTPSRRAGRQRRYERTHLTRIAIIIQGKELGFSLDEIRTVLDSDDAGGRRRLLAGHHAALGAV